jgi:O-antigen/teichoic acid export membrane protein
MTTPVSERRRKWFGWLNLLARFASVQIVIQVLGFVSGILIVRNLSKPDYAWFTIANTLIATLSMLADSGVTGAVSALGGKIWQDNEKLSVLVSTALSLRRWLALAATAILTPVFVWMLSRANAPAVTVAVVVAVALLGFFLGFTANVMSVGIWLRQELRRLQTLALVPALLRAAMLAIASLIFIDAQVAVIVGVLAAGIQILLLRHWERGAIRWNLPSDPECRGRIVAVLKRQAPLTVFYCVQTQIVVWLISVFGRNEQVAEVGAIGRFAMIFTLVSSVVNGIVVPRFARCQDPAVLRRRYWQVAAGFASFASVLVALSALFPGVLLWVLGPKYAHLTHEIWLFMLSAALGGMFATLHAMAFCKTWIVPAIVSIPVEIGVQVLLILSLDLSTVHGVLLTGCLSNLVPIALTVFVAQREMKKAAHSPPPPAVPDTEIPEPE